MTANSKYRFPESALSSARHFFDIVPHDTNEITQQLKGIYVGGTGDIVARGKDSSADVTFKAVPVGAVLDIDPQFIKTATTATLLVGLA